MLDLSGPLADVGKRASARAEEEAIRLAMQDCAGDRNAAAARLGLSPPRSTAGCGTRARSGQAGGSQLKMCDPDRVELATTGVGDGVSVSASSSTSVPWP